MNWCLLRSVREKRRDWWESNTWSLHHDSAPAHTSLSIWKFLADKNVTVLKQLSYSPDLAPCDFFLFPEIKSIIKEIRFSSTNVIKNAVAMELREISQESFQKSIDAWKSGLEKCVKLKGDYFEGDNV